MKKFKTQDFVFIALFIFIGLDWIFNFPRTLYWGGALVLAIIYFWLAHFRAYFKKR